MRTLSVALAGCLLAACSPKAGHDAAFANTHREPDAQDVKQPDATAVLAPRELSITAADGVEVLGDLFETEQDKPRPLILLFHQAGSNAGEYATIAPRLQRLGYNALAIDQRSGGERWDRKNRTVARLGESTSYLDAYPDLETSLAWAKQQGYPRVLIWGSSYSAALVFKLAAEHADEVFAVLAFSPGEYIEGRDGAVREWASGVAAPIYLTSASGEEITAAATIGAASPSTDKTQHEPKHGVHGASTLRDDSNAAGAAENWVAVEAFLVRVAP